MESIMDRLYVWGQGWQGQAVISLITFESVYEGIRTGSAGLFWLGIATGIIIMGGCFGRE